MLGLCTGLLPAAAAVVANDISELLKFGLEIIATSVRLAHEITLRSMHIEEAPGSWAYTIVGVTAEESQAVLHRFHQTQVCFCTAINDHVKLTESEYSGA